MLNFEFLIPKRPLSLQAKGRRLQVWKDFVRAEAARVWNGPAIDRGELQMTLVYLSGEGPADIDNIIKPIQDALVDLVFSDDRLISDIDGHRRPLSGSLQSSGFHRCWRRGQECVYVRVRYSRLLGEYL